MPVLKANDALPRALTQHLPAPTGLGPAIAYTQPPPSSKVFWWSRLVTQMLPPCSMILLAVRQCS